jgi:hypothetical protein
MRGAEVEGFEGVGRGLTDLIWAVGSCGKVGKEKTSRLERVKKSKSCFSGPRKILSASEIVAPIGSCCVFSSAECGQILAGQFLHTFLPPGFRISVHSKGS